MIRHGILESSRSKAAAWPTSGLVARWTFDDTLTDTVNSITLSEQGTGSISYVTGKVGKAVKFSAGTKYLETTSSTVYNVFRAQHAFSVSFWVNKPGQAVLSANVGTSFAFSVQTYFTAFRSAGGTFMLLSNDSYTLDDGIWRHAVVTYDGTTMKTYRDNYNWGSTTANNVTMGNITNFWLNQRGGFAGVANAMFDMVYIYDRALTSDEISQLYNGGDGI